MTLSPARLWRDVPRETLVLGAIAVTASAALAGTAISTPSLSDLGISAATIAEAPPTPPPLLVRPLAPEAALSINRTIPLAATPNPVARPFAWRGADLAARARALDCLTSAVYYEAGSEPADGQRAVAQVVLNRVRHPAFPGSVCGVVYQGSTRATGCQFTFTCDGSLARRPSTDGWVRARTIAAAALAGAVYAPAGYATHYHADYVVPYWASSLAKNAVVGAHIFYRWAGGWGQPAAFIKGYAGHEPNSQALRAAAMAAAASRPLITQAIAAIPGAEIKLVPGGRLSVRFKVAARKAADEAPHYAYVDKFKASDNLRWSLSGGAPEASQAPLGRASTAVAAGGGSGASLR
ncbi:cell wall hydrolase [Sphingomonas sp.]|uniref:cell wall hydrolase n=1 Tax=Sphingomonas sp. TaxID=28214 RepID=UPI00286CD9A6|nr:cell wall hydrolase [Sphingomonas sp.]